MFKSVLLFYAAARAVRQKMREREMHTPCFCAGCRSVHGGHPLGITYYVQYVPAYSISETPRTPKQPTSTVVEISNLPFRSQSRF